MNVLQAESQTFCVSVHALRKNNMCGYACVLIFKYLFTGNLELRSQKLLERGKFMIFHSEQSTKRNWFGKNF